MLEISPQKVVHVIYLARETGAGDAELHAFIDALNDDEKAQLTAVAWVGRGAFEPEDFAEAAATAAGSRDLLTLSRGRCAVGRPPWSASPAADRAARRRRVRGR